MFARALLRNRQSANSLGALALVSLSVALTSSSASYSTARTEPTVEKRNAAAYLNADGVSTLNKHFPPVHKEVVKTPHMTIAYIPEGANLARIATQVGRPVDLQVRAIVTDKHAQTLVVDVVKATEDDDGGVPFLVENSVPHVTVSVSNAHDGYGPFYSNHLLSRARAAAGTFDKDWEGKLPARDGYEETTCTITVPKERTVLTATLCTSDLWNEEASRCGEEKQCGFCRFMKLGPCGKEFAAWEACIDASKETEQDFIEMCGQQTLVLKSCVDKNPEYYFSIMDNGPEDGEAEQEGIADTEETEGAASQKIEGASEVNQTEAPAETAANKAEQPIVVQKVEENKIEIVPDAKVEIALDASVPIETPKNQEEADSPSDYNESYFTKG